MGAALQLTTGQQAAYEGFAQFVIDPNEHVFVLKGYAGTGKTTLVEYLIEQISKLFRTLALVDPKQKNMELVLTATTNKAAEAFELAAKQQVRTIQSVLGLRVEKNYVTQVSTLVPAPKAEIVRNALIIIDEASYVDSHLLDLIFKRTENCKIMFIGDPAQLTPVKSSQVPVFNAGFPTAELTEVVRQAKGNPIIDLSTAFRNTVNTGEFFSFKPDGQHIQWLPREAFEAEIVKEFNRPDWTDRDSKVLAWTNKTVIGYNHGIRNLVKGSPQFSEGDYAVCNAYIHTRDCQIKTDQMVRITSMTPAEEHDVPGFEYTLDNRHTAFMPTNPDDKKKRVNLAKEENQFDVVSDINRAWIDLRAAYACTINKSQGSTYNAVFIDLDDVKKCRDTNQVARMLYVAVSRARYKVFFTGDLI